MKISKLLLMLMLAFITYGSAEAKTLNTSKAETALSPQPRVGRGYGPRFHRRPYYRRPIHRPYYRRPIYRHRYYGRRFPRRHF